MKRIGTASDGKFIVLVDPDEAAELQTAAGKILAALNGFAPVTAGDPLEERVHIATRLEQFSSRRPAKRKTKAGNKRAKAITNKRVDAGQLDAKLCRQCEKPMPKGSNRKTHKGECTKLYAREYARKWYQQKHGLVPAPAARPTPAAAPVSTASPVSDAARKIAAMREARLLEADRIASLDQ
jgi:hypothetical protein